MPRLRPLAALLAAALCLPLAPRAEAGSVADPGAPWVTQIDLTRATGMAGAMAAFASGNDALTVNPAGLALNRSYHFQLDGVDDVKFPAEGVIASIADSTTLGVGSGIIFQRWGAGQPGGRGEGWQGGLGYAYQAGGIYFGGVTHLVHFAVPGGDSHGWSQDAGLMFNSGGLSWGAVLQNFTFGDALPTLPLTSTLAVAYGSDRDFHLAIDYQTNLSNFDDLKHQISFGGELLLDTNLALRAGYRWDVSDRLAWATCGATIITERLSIGLALRRRVQGAMEQALEAGVTLFLE